MKGELLAIGVTAIFWLQVQGLTVDISKSVPSSRKYVPHGYAINEVPSDRNYDDIECTLVGSSVQSSFDDHKTTSDGKTFNENKAMQKFSTCRQAICGSAEILKKLQSRPQLMEELSSVAITFGQQFHPEYKVFRNLIDPTFAKILSDLGEDEFPILRSNAFSRQRNMAYSIITIVCGHQPQTIKAELSPTIVSEIFGRTIVPTYIHKAFSNNIGKWIVGNATKTSISEKLWTQAARQRVSDHPCMDPDLEDHDNHATIEALQELASSLHGVTCTRDSDSDYYYEYDSVSYAPPPSDNGPSDNAPPTFDGPDGGPPDQWSSANTFSP